MNRLLFCILASLFLVIGIEVFYLFSLPKKNSQSLPSSVPSPLPLNSPTPEEFPGVGFVYASSPSARLAYVVGKVEGWQEIAGSEDKYLVLTNPKTAKEIATVRVIFDKEGLTTQKPLTGLAVEDLSAVKSGRSGFSPLKPAADYGFEKLKKAVASGDVVVVKPRYNNPQQANYLLDEQKILIAQWLIVRRSLGRVAIEKELE